MSIGESAPETYLSLVALDTIYATIDSSGAIQYAIDEDPSSNFLWDTLEAALTTITTSRQELHWWGEDSDGNIEGYYYKWSSDTGWSYTELESGVFYVPIRSDLDVFSFEVKAIDNFGNEDPTPSKLTLPIKNSSPEISFRYRSNPLIADIGGDTFLLSQQELLYGTFMIKMGMRPLQMCIILLMIHVAHVGFDWMEM